MTTFREPIVRNSWFRNKRNILTKYKTEDETEVYTSSDPLWDLTDWLRSGETVSSVTWSANGGLGVASTGNSTTAVYATITKTGSVDVQVTTSASRIRERRFQWIGSDEPAVDYPS